MDGTLIMSTRHELRPAKKVYLYRNGVTDTQPKCMVVNDRQIRDFSSFLSRATSGLRAPVAIRNIYTPAGGHKVKSLDALETGRYYVAGGTEHFKRVKYGNEIKRLLPRRQQRTNHTLPNKGQANSIVASARYKRPIEKPCVIHVFRNGDERYRGAKILIPRRMMGSWEYVLELVTEKSGLITPAKRLCTLDGRALHAISELQDGGKYVALEGTKPFQRVSYCATEDKKLSPLRVAATVPRTIHRLKKKLPPRPRAAKQNQETEISKPAPPVENPNLNKVLERRKSRPFGGRKNKEGRVKAIEDHRADSIFGGSPAITRPASPGDPLEPIKASPLNASLDAQQDSLLAPSPPISFHHQTPKTLDSPVEEPPLVEPSPFTHTTEHTGATEEVIEEIDSSIPAAAPLDEIGDLEEVLEEPAGNSDGDKADKLPKPVAVEEGQNYGKANTEELKELESYPLKNSIDLSIQRNKQQLVDSNQSNSSLSKRSSAKSKQSSRKTSPSKSRPRTMEKVNGSQTHSVLNVNKPESQAPQGTTDYSSSAAEPVDVSGVENGESEGTSTSQGEMSLNENTVQATIEDTNTEQPDDNKEVSPVPEVAEETPEEIAEEKPEEDKPEETAIDSTEPETNFVVEDPQTSS